jgi:two-component system response regulator BaeR
MNFAGPETVYTDPVRERLVRRPADRGPVIFALASRRDGAMLTYLANVGYIVCVKATIRELVAAVDAERPSIVLLNLPHKAEQAMLVCQQVKTCADIPVIRISPRRARDQECVMCLEQGADDYVRRPVSPREIGARIKCILRRSRPSSVETAGLTIDCDRYFAALDGVPLALTPAEFRLLAALDDAHERVVPRSELMRAVSCDRVRSERAVDSLIRNLRRKLQAASPARTLVHATYATGYHLSR